MHIDLLEVRLDEKIQTHRRASSSTGVEEAPGVKEGGVLEHVTRELNIEALPTDIPEDITVDVSAPRGRRHDAPLRGHARPRASTFLDDPEETIIATITVADRDRGAGDRGGDRARRRGRRADRGARGRGGRGPPRARAARLRPRATPPRSPEATSPEPVPRVNAAGGSTGWSSGSATRATATRAPATTSASRSRTSSRRRWDLPRAKKKYAGLLHRRPHGARRPARRRAPAADLHERGRPLGRPRARRARRGPRPRARDPRRDRPAVRRRSRRASAAGWPATTG